MERLLKPKLVTSNRTYLVISIIATQDILFRVSSSLVHYSTGSDTSMDLRLQDYVIIGMEAV